MQINHFQYDFLCSLKIFKYEKHEVVINARYYCYLRIIKYASSTLLVLVKQFPHLTIYFLVLLQLLLHFINNPVVLKIVLVSALLKDVLRIAAYYGL
jgi:hypothetical protein